MVLKRICFLSLMYCTLNAIQFNAVVATRTNETRDSESRIVGGGYATIAKYPHSAYLGITEMDKNKQGMNYMCGASILNQLILLSAGHCVESCTAESTCNVLVSVGHVDWNEGILHGMETFRLHENYNTDTIENDIALLKLQEPLLMGRFVSRVTILNNPPMHEAASLAGWGLYDEYSEMNSEILKELKNIKLLDRAECNGIITMLPERTFCARRIGDDQNYAASGDSGSALMVKNFIQIGLVSFKNPQSSRSLIVYTEISKFIPWLKRNAIKLLCNRKRVKKY